MQAYDLQQPARTVTALPCMSAWDSEIQRRQPGTLHCSNMGWTMSTTMSLMQGLPVDLQNSAVAVQLDGVTSSPVKDVAGQHTL